MPRGDGTGPIGMGPLTGKRLGNCIAYGVPLVAGMMSGFGRGRGFGRGFCFWGTVVSGAAALYFAGKNKRKLFKVNNNSNISNEADVSVLKNQANILENSLTEVRNRISELERNKQKEA